MNSPEISALSAKLDEALSLLNRIAGERKAPMSVTRFALLSGRSRTTVHRMLKRGDIRKQGNRIPWESASRFL